MNVDDLVRKKRLSQTQFASLVDVNQSTISKAMSAGILTPGADWITWNRQLLHHAMEVSASRRSDGEFDLVRERARLAKMQADRMVIEIKTTLREVLHLEPIAVALGAVFSGVKTKLLGLPYKIKSRVPYIAPKMFR
jgi:phage terminase Nu1 subunit (DNA packaging protein)